jgi:hypothetical protein
MRFSDGQVERALDHATRQAAKRGHTIGAWTRTSQHSTLNQFQSNCGKCGRTMFWSGYGMTGTALKEDCKPE